MDFHLHFARDAGICGGETVIRGTRVTLRTLLASLAEGATVEEIVADFPTVTPNLCVPSSPSPRAARAMICRFPPSPRSDET